MTASDSDTELVTEAVEGPDEVSPAEPPATEDMRRARFRRHRKAEIDAAGPSIAKRRRRSRSLVAALVGIGLLLMATAAAATIRYLEAPASARVLGDNYPVNLGARDLSDISAHNSPILVQNPTDQANLAVANRIDSPRYSCAVHISFDGGASWRQTPLPIPKGESPKCFAPDVAFGADGKLYILYVTLKGAGNVPNAVWIVTSSDGGLTLSEPGEEVLGPLSFQVGLTPDPTTPERLYLTWLEAEEVALFQFVGTSNPIRFAVSDDGGASWNDPVTVTPATRERVAAPSLAVGPEGDLYLLYLDMKDDRLDYEGAHGGLGGPPHDGPFELVLARSEDGNMWQETTIDSAVVPVERFVVFLPPTPSLAVDESDGTIYVAYQDGRLGDPDVWLWSSTDGGVTWTGAIRINDTPRSDGTYQLLPQVAVAPDGRVDVIYYDRRADPEDIMNEVSLQSSFDAGRTFQPRVVLSDTSFDSRIGLRGDRGLPDLGSRLALLSTKERSFAIWTDTRSGTDASLKQDLVRAVVEFSERPVLAPIARAGLRYGGGGLGVLGALLVVASLIGRKPREETEAVEEDEPAA
ncbi:MAG TPA: sialidase family protein [Egibacteraceae bacterium]|nr:sialidase family protein [Egibacteraceae bacterium]